MVDQIDLEYKRAEWSCMWLMWSHHGVFKSESFQRVLPYCLDLRFYDRDETFETIIPLFLRTALTSQRTWTPQKVQKTWWKGWSALLRYHHHHTYTEPLYKSPSSYFRWIFIMPFPLSSSLKSLNDNPLWNPGAVGPERDHGLQVTPLLRRRRLGQHHPVNCSLYTRGMQLTQC